ncbi:MAG TPA: hypothetical protein VLJ18_07520 [Thermoanaerobaculia bacterium]|nr:hypothetical protein [Thermoanaerobaculia bacterium]
MSARGKAPKSNLKVLLFALAAVLGLAVLSYVPKGPGATESAEAVPASGRPRAARGVSDPESVPDLTRIAARGSAEEKVGRNVFRFHESPTPTPRPTPIPTPTPVLPGSPLYVGPMPIQPTPTPTPIVPPALPFKALGIFGSRDEPIVSLEEGGRIINAREGDTVDGRFIVKKINRESVDFTFTGLPHEITRRIPVPLP